ncbi:uncharacterized protein LOC114131700 [Aphis gossypii]|uniref:uncharacterized protein LOC114131700 n=1 Tax=Aphis gossypii TaxID=80765 RepID=UPI0021592576|nr:uncharacterized protein LOC114131700 [Aphis gossypii]
MIHGPCGQLNPFSVCMKDGQCKCNYPRKLLDVTRSDKNGYPLYRRRSITNGGFQTAINVKLLRRKRGPFFLDAPGSTGKTFLLNLILAEVRKSGNIALAVASSGVAATLLHGGQEPICNIIDNPATCKLLKQTNVIIWDECTMANKKGPEALDKTLQDLKKNNFIMRKVIVILAGDFRQTLPIISRGTPADQIHARDTNLENFSKQLILLGDGKWERNSDDTIKFPSNFCRILDSVHSLIIHVYPDIDKNYISHEWLWVCKTFKSIDTVCHPEHAIYYPMEFLNSLEISGLPSHILTLKIGAPIMVLRNLNPPKLCYSTRLCVKTLKNNIIEGIILTGCGKEEHVYIPRIPLKPTDTPFEFERLQIPVRLSFSFTINKSQGQLLRTTGVYLETPWFSYGQLYVACSRGGDPKNLH